MFKSDVKHLRNSLELAVGLDELVMRESLWKHWGAVPARCGYGAPCLQVLLHVGVLKREELMAEQFIVVFRTHRKSDVAGTVSCLSLSV